MNARPAKLVLVTEDQAIIALALQHELEDLGYEVAGPFPTCRLASEWLAAHTPDLAILDVELRDGPCTDVAIELARRGVETVVFSGLPRRLVPEAFPSSAWFEKPAQLKDLLGRLGNGRSGAQA